ncbi:CIC family chloride channel protein [Chitinophaga skermanii]|uniref:CIC family chloride channel protein n=1 Tax=Chitinophaga skermanii TaxID=331697 RepID=A0A327QR13_9BACT|nr:chloride channel protein [Chitinophaga skermanii]RAJ06681.1 CIC family chloride channel protein [Chitinophaga skermanii]
MSKYSKIRARHGFLRFKRDFEKYSIKKAKQYEIVLMWLHSKMSRSQFLLLSGILVGCTAGLAGVVLKMLVSYIHYVITHKVYFSTQVFFYAVFPFLGIVLTTLIVQLFFKGQDRKGIGVILYEIARNGSNVPRVKMFSQIVQSAVTVGLGGSAGLESPIAVTGSAIGSNYAQTYKLDYKERTLLLAAGATAGVASAFNAPIAGMMFAFEILLTGIVFSDFIPLIVAAVCGSLISKIILHEEALFHFESRTAFNYRNVPLYVVLGILCGFYARYFLVIAGKVEHFFKHLRITKLQKAMIGGAVLSLMCVALPPLFGEGYSSVKLLANEGMTAIIENSFFQYFKSNPGWILFFVGCVVVLKAIATSITIQSGGNGGNFAPSLFAGAFVGYFFAMLCVWVGIPNVPVTNFVIVGMAGVMGGVMYAPLTAIFLIAESSTGYDLFIPLMIVSLTAYLIVKKFSPVSPELKHLADEGKIFTRTHDSNITSLLDADTMLERNFGQVKVDEPFQALLDIFKNTNFQYVAITTEHGQLAGFATLETMRPYVFDANKQTGATIANTMIAPTAIAFVGESVNSILRKFDTYQLWLMPVVKEGKPVGFLEKSTLLQQYRELWQQYSGVTS